MSVEILPGCRAVELANPDTGDNRRLEVPCVDTHSALGSCAELLPVRSAATYLAVHSLNCARTPNISRCALGMTVELDRCCGVKRPKCPVAAADGAIAVHQIFGLLQYGDAYRTAVTCRLQHEESPLAAPNA
jgi:hypothetical protein